METNDNELYVNELNFLLFIICENSLLDLIFYFIKWSNWILFVIKCTFNNWITYFLFHPTFQSSHFHELSAVNTTDKWLKTVNYGVSFNILILEITIWLTKNWNAIILLINRKTFLTQINEIFNKNEQPSER